MPEQNTIQWNRIAIEAIAIVGSILLAFAIDAWWDDRKERDFEQEVLHGLRAEYESNKQSINWQRDFQIDSLSAIENLMQACRSGTYPSDDISIDRAVFVLQVGLTTDLGNGVRDSLISAGRINALSDQELRYMLSEWDSVLDELIDGQIFNRRMTLHTVIPILIRLNIPMSGGMDGEDSRPWPIPAQSIADDPEVTARMFADGEFCSMLEFRYGHMNHTLDEFDDVLGSIDEISTRIEASIR